MPQIKHYARGNQLELFPGSSNLDNNRSSHIPAWQKEGGGFLGCVCVTRFYDNSQNNISNGAAWSTMKYDVTDGAIYLPLSFARDFPKKNYWKRTSKKLSILLKEKTNKQIDNIYGL